MPDPFESHLISLVLSWAICTPIAVGFVCTPFIAVFRAWRDDPSQEGNQLGCLILGLWAAVCFLILSPWRYIGFQWVLGAAYANQGYDAAISFPFLLGFAPIVAPTLWAIGLCLPVLGIAAIAGHSGKPRILLTAVAAPFLCAAGYALFFLVLPVAASFGYWIPDEDLLRATNGPAEYYYRFMVEPDVPRLGPRLEGEQGATPLARLRAHVAHTYVSPKQQTIRHFKMAILYLQTTNKAMAERPSLDVTDSQFADAVQGLKAALREAESADPTTLNNEYPGLGTACHGKLVKGLQMMIQGCEDHSELMVREGAQLVEKFQEWLASHPDDLPVGA